MRADRRAGRSALVGYLIDAIAEDHDATLLHYDADFDRLATHTDLAIAVEPLAELGSLP